MISTDDRVAVVRAKARGVRRRARNMLLAARGKPVPRPRAKPTGNPLRTYFDNNQGRQIHKYLHYFAIYQRHFRAFRNKPVTVVEFGVNHGGSLQMWRDYFGEQARIVGVDINPACAEFADVGAEVVIGDQEDREFLRSLARRLGRIDVLIEDGGHTMVQQIATFEEFWPYIAEGGVYLVEDLHTSYWSNYGGGHRKPGTFIEYAKNLVDQQNAWHSREEGFAVDDYTRTIGGMHVYDSIIVFDKTEVTKPRAQKKGVRSF